MSRLGESSNMSIFLLSLMTEASNPSLGVSIFLTDSGREAAGWK